MKYLKNKRAFIAALGIALVVALAIMVACCHKEGENPKETPTPIATFTPEVTISPTEVVTVTSRPTEGITNTPTIELTPTSEPDPTVTEEPTPEITEEPTSTPTPSPTEEPTSTPTPSPKPTSTPSPVPPKPTNTATPVPPTPTTPPEPTTAPPTPTTPPPPTEEPSPSPTPTVAPPSIDFDSYLNKLQSTHIAPFLNGYVIETRNVTFTGRYISEGIGSYLVEYVCVKGDQRVLFGFYTTVMSYNSDVVKDEIDYSYIELEVFHQGLVGGYWETITTYNNTRGLAAHLN